MFWNEMTSQYNSVINADFDACGFMNGTDKNPFAKWVVDVIAKTVPEGFLHPCPYEGLFAAHNVSIGQTERAKNFLNGRYRMLLRYFDDVDENITTAFMQMHYFTQRRKKSPPKSGR